MMIKTEDSNVQDNKPATNKCPRGDRFRQQKLPAWQPVITVKTALPLVVFVALVFIPLGAFLLITSKSVQEVTVPYSGSWCSPTDVNIRFRYLTCDDFIRRNPGCTCDCIVKFNIEQPMVGQVYIFYALTNFFQNHRRYVKSRDWRQLRGSKVNYRDLTYHCDPFRGIANASLAYAPCGAIANSLFNDTFSLFYEDQFGSMTPVQMIRTGICWDSDKQTMFRNPTAASAWSKTVPPPNWQHPVDRLDPSDMDNTGYENEDLIVWMRTAAFPDFRKLYRIVNHTEDPFKGGLPSGSYSLSIGYAFPVADFGGTKSLVLTTTTWLGGRNPFLGIAYLVVGSIFGLFSIAFIVIQKKYGTSSWDEMDLSKGLVADEDLQMPPVNTGGHLEEEETST